MLFFRFQKLTPILTGLLSGVIRLCGEEEEEDIKGGPAPSSDADVGAVVPMLSLRMEPKIRSNHSAQFRVNIGMKLSFGNW